MALFGFGGGGQQETPEHKQRREASEESLRRGGLPLDAVDRLREQAGRQGTPGHIFSSDLSVNELALVHEAGFDPLGQVMGSTIYHVGWQWNNPAWQGSGWQTSWTGASFEFEVMTQAFYHARHLALGRLAQEAQLLGATGVVGVRLERKEYEWGAGLLEFAAIGTAIRERDVVPPHQGGPAVEPVLSDLSGQEFWQLRRAGYRPTGIAVGNCTYYAIPSWRTQNANSGGWFSGSWVNQELTDYTQGVYNARALAMSRMEHEALQAGASGVVGVDMQMEAEPREVEVNNNQSRTDMIYHFTAIGTAIVPFAPFNPPSPRLVVPLAEFGPRNRAEFAKKTLR